MLKNIELSREVAKAEYKRLKGDADLKLAALQRQVKALGIPVIIVFEGWSAAGKGTLINELILPLDPRGFTVHSARRPTEEQAFYPFLWRFWKRTPTRGRLAIFDRSWNRKVVTDRIEGQVKGRQLRQAFEDIRSFERQLAAHRTPDNRQKVEIRHRSICLRLLPDRTLFAEAARDFRSAWPSIRLHRSHLQGDRLRRAQLRCDLAGLSLSGRHV